MITFDSASKSDANNLSKLRKKVWLETYKDIYDSNYLDAYNYLEHEERFKQMITNKNYIVKKIIWDKKIIGYFIFGKAPKGKFSIDYPICLYSLYILQEYHNKKIGTKVMDYIKEYCKKNDVKVFYNGCNYYNDKAKKFYKKMGGKVFALDIGYENKIENQCFFRYTLF